MDDRTTRYRDLLPVDRLAATAATVIGTGAIGRPVALQLAAMGIGGLRLVDPDTVDPVNLGPQGYREADVGKPKVEAVAHACRELHGALPIETVADRFRRDRETTAAVFCCVDSIAARRSIWRALEGRVGFFADARMAAEALRVLTVADEDAGRHYRSTLFADDAAYHAPCTARSTGYAALVAAGLLVAQFAKWLRGHPLDAELRLNLLAMEFEAVTPEG